MLAAISASAQGKEVILLERNEKPGKKLFITGKGRCNITNACSPEEFLGHGTLGRDAPSLEMYVPGQVAPPAAGSIPEVGFDQPPRPGERGAGALTRRAYEAVSSLLDGLAAPDTARH